ncbi:MAG: hypothetical protein QXF12_02560 [Candidatus Aenigmatarchaeota archaeon]
MPSTKNRVKAIIKDKKGRVLSLGQNSYFKTHPIMYKIAKQKGIKTPVKIFLHAEVDAINKCKDINKAYRIEVYRTAYEKVKKDKILKYRLSRPCDICLSLIKKTPIREICYFDSEENFIVEYL